MTMRIRATMTLRNDVLIAHRQAMGLTQRQAAHVCGVGIWAYQKVEAMDFISPSVCAAAVQIATTWELPLTQIMPDALIGEKVQSRAAVVVNMAPERLLASEVPARFILPSPADVAEGDEAKEALAAAINGLLMYRERQVLRLRMGLDGERAHTLEEVGQAICVSRERARMIEAKAMRRLRMIGPDNPLTPFIEDDLKAHQYHRRLTFPSVREMIGKGNAGDNNTGDNMERTERK